MGLIDKVIVWLIMSLCHISFPSCKQPIMYIKGTGKRYPRYLLYTEDPNVYERMDDF